MKTCYSILCILLFSSCGHYVQVAKVNVDRTNLASTFARSPDPDQAAPSVGEKLYVSWSLPFSLQPQDHQIVLSVVYKDLTEEKKTYPLEHRLGVISFPLLDKKFDDTKGFFAYQALLVDKEEKVIDKWEHQMWIKVIH